MKFLLALTFALAVGIDARSFIPKKIFEETYFDKDKYDTIAKDVNFDFNDVFGESETPFKPDYYRYFTPKQQKYVTPDAEEYFNKKDFDAKKEEVETYYDPKEKYDYDTFVRYFTSQPILSTVTKYFPFTKKTTDDVKEVQGDSKYYYPIPKEVVELVKTSKDLKNTLRQIVKYFYNLPDDVKAVVVEKYDFENVVKFLLQVYYDIPYVAHGLTTYYDIPTSVVSELKTEYDLKAVIDNILARYYEWTKFERDYYTKYYFDVTAVVSTLVKVYYGVPQFDKYDVEYYYNDADFLRKFVYEFGKKYDYVQVVDTIFERRSRLTDEEKEYYDRFFNVQEYVKYLVKAYYYGVKEASKKPFETYYTKAGFYKLLSKIYYYYNDEQNTTEEGDYPLEYYLKTIFGKKSYKNFDFPTTKGYFPFGGKYDKFFKGFFGDYKYGFPYYGYPSNTRRYVPSTYGYPEAYPRPYGYNYYPEEFYGREFFGDYYYPRYGFDSKKDVDFPYYYNDEANYYPKTYNFLAKIFGKKYAPFFPQGEETADFFKYFGKYENIDKYGPSFGKFFDTIFKKYNKEAETEF